MTPRLPSTPAPRTSVQSHASLRAVIAAIPFALVACSSQPAPRATTEAPRLVQRIAPLSEALTLALVPGGGTGDVVLVTDDSGDTFRGVRLSEAGHGGVRDPIDAAPLLGDRALIAFASDRRNWREFSKATVHSPAGSSDAQVAGGTNFPEHAAETSLSAVFMFPKFGASTPARTRVDVAPGELLDYEVELCARFDRPLNTVADFEQATKGFFLCGDFTDRANLLRGIKLGNITSGIGFTDAKSGPGRFPTGPFLVIPRDWRAFTAQERITTSVNGTERQNALGGDMILDFEKLVGMALQQAGDPRYVYRGAPVPLFEGTAIARGVSVMSGTPDGVVFRPPASDDITSAVLRYAGAGIFRGDSFQQVLASVVVERQAAARTYLQAGDVVKHASSRMGDMVIDVVPRAR